MRLALLGVIVLACLCTATLAAQEPYKGSKPPKPDIPYLVQADNLIPSEVAEAKQENRKDEIVFVIPGAASPVKTPMAMPMFLFQPDKIAPETIELYKLDVQNGNREVSGGRGKKRKDASRPLRLSITQLGEGLYRIESYGSLDPGEYSLSPNGSNQAFCFAVY